MSDIATPVDPFTQRRALMAAALKDKSPLAALDPTCQWTDSKDQAAVTALNKGGNTKDIREIAGAIYQNAQGQYCYSIPVQGKEEHFQFRAQTSPDQTMVGIYHTHPGRGDDAQIFSPDDVATANQLKMQSYIKALQSGVIKRYDPGISKVKPEHNSAGTYLPNTTS